MSPPLSLEDRIAAASGTLSARLNDAAEFVLANPADVATRSLRAAAAASGVSPATFSRLARALGYADYEALREDRRRSLTQRALRFSERAHALRRDAAADDPTALWSRQTAAGIANIEVLAATLDPEKLSAAAEALHRARTVLLVGSLGSAGFMAYFGYLAKWFDARWVIDGGAGVEVGLTLPRLGPDDAIVALAKAPYARRSVMALQAARGRGLAAVVITDSATSPALRYADHRFVTPSDGPQFFSSYAATVVLIEALAGSLLAKAGPEAEERIECAEQHIDSLGENWIG